MFRPREVRGRGCISRYVAQYRSPHKRLRGAPNLSFGANDRGPAAREDRDSRPERRWVVERARIDIEHVGLAELAAEHEAAAGGATVARCVAAAEGLRHRRPGLARHAHRAGCKSHERDEPGAGRLLAVDAVAVAGEARLAGGFVAQCAAQAAAGVALGFGHAAFPFIAASVSGCVRSTTSPVSSSDLRLERICGQPPETFSMNCEFGRSMAWVMVSFTAPRVSSIS